MKINDEMFAKYNAEGVVAGVKKASAALASIDTSLKKNSLLRVMVSNGSM